MQILKTLSQDSEIYDCHQDIVVEGELSEDGLAVSEDEYWEKYYHHPDFSYEWNNGYLEVKPMADIRSSAMYRWFLSILECYFSTYPIGIIINLDIGFRLPLPHKTSVRKPDAAIILHKNSVTASPDDCSYAGVFDMCIESLSYSALKEIKRDTVDKKKEYEGIGVKEYYILDARGRETAFYYLNKKGKYEKIRTGRKGMVQSKALPGFQFKISDLYERPSLKRMAEDEVYCRYVLPFYQDAIQRAEQEKQRADESEKQLVLEKQRAERLAQKLRSLGVIPE